jgi:DNA-binding NtrC family response regulator
VQVANILSVSYLPSLLQTREELLKTEGHAVTSAHDLRSALRACKRHHRFQLFIIGHSIPRSHKDLLIETFRENQPKARIIALTRIGEEPVRDADLVIEPEPRVLLRSVAELISGKGTSA